MKNLESAVEFLRLGDGSTIVRQSQTYETEPIGLKDQPDFLNRVVEVQTELTPNELLQVLQRVESRFGRKREMPNGPRPIDLDVLLYHDWVVSTERLTLPHPRMSERRFVLVPLLELESSLRNPRSGGKFRDSLDSIDTAGQGVELYRG